MCFYLTRRARQCVNCGLATRRHTVHRGDHAANAETVRLLRFCQQPQSILSGSRCPAWHGCSAIGSSTLRWTSEVALRGMVRFVRRGPRGLAPRPAASQQIGKADAEWACDRVAAADGSELPASVPRLQVKTLIRPLQALQVLEDIRRYQVSAALALPGTLRVCACACVCVCVSE